MTTAYIWWQDPIELKDLLFTLERIMPRHGYSVSRRFSAGFLVPGEVSRTPGRDAKLQRMDGTSLAEVLSDARLEYLQFLRWSYIHDTASQARHVSFNIPEKTTLGASIRHLGVSYSWAVGWRCHDRSEMREFSRYYHLVRELMFALKADRAVGWDSDWVAPMPEDAESAEMWGDFRFQPVGLQFISQRLEDGVEADDDLHPRTNVEVFVQPSEVDWYRYGGSISRGPASPWNMGAPVCRNYDDRE